MLITSVDRQVCQTCVCVSATFRYWYPLNFFLSLSFQPTAMLLVNKDMALPKTDAVVSCKPSLFAYLTPLVAEKKEEVRCLACTATCADEHMHRHVS